MKREKEGTYSPIRKRGNGLANNKPLSAITNKAFNRADKKKKPSRESVRGKASKKTKSFTNIFSNRKIV